MRDQHTLHPVIRRGAAVRALLGLGLWPIMVVQPVAAALAHASASATTDALALLALLAVAHWGFGVPVAATVPRAERWLLGAAAAAVVGAAALRAPALPGDLGPGDAVLPVLAVLLGILALYDRRPRLTDRTTSLHWPLPGGQWQVVEGLGRALNHHWPAPAQRGALDLVGVTRGGRSHHGLLPARLQDYPIYRVPVLAPAAGVVLAAVDGHPDHPDRHAGPAGNHVVIDTGHEHLTLAHLSPGTVTATPGQRVEAGQQIGRVGSSGSSTEPHLHIHATRASTPIQLEFTGIRSSYRRGTRIHTTPAPQHTARTAPAPPALP